MSEVSRLTLFYLKFHRPRWSGAMVRLAATGWLAALLFLIGLTPARGQAPIGGSWVWSSGQASPVNAYAYFRRAFTLSAAPTAATVRVTADTRYVLYVNGRRIGRGPARSHTKYLAYDTWDVRADLVTGKNVIAALVNHVGESTFRNQAGRAGFLCDAAISVGAQTVTVRTDGTWKALDASAWDASQGRMNIALGFAEVYDARKAPQGWEGVSFDDSAWPSATVLGPAGMAPWTNLTPSDIPPNRETDIHPSGLVDVLEVEAPPDAMRIPFGRLYERSAWAVGFAMTYLYAPKDTAVTLQVGGDDGLRLFLNGQVLLERTSPRDGYPDQDTVAATLRAGWNPVLIKSAKLLGPWDVFLAVVGANAAGVVASSERDTKQPATFRIAPETPFDGGKGVLAGLNMALSGDTATDFSTWQKISAPLGEMVDIGPLMRHEARRHPTTPRVLNATAMLDPSGLATFQSTGRSDGSVVLDMGKQVLGYPVIVVPNARGGEILDVGYVEALEDANGQPVSPANGPAGVVNPERGGVNYADRFICRPGANTFEPFEKRGFRFMQIDVRNAAEPLLVDAPTVTLASYPVEERGRFTCSDERLNRIWDIGRWTLALNMDDSYTDCVWRERALWWGDTHVESLVNYYAFGDTKLIRRALKQAAETQDADGILRGIFPTDWYGARIPSYDLIWVQSIWEYYRYTGDATLFPLLMPAVDKQMAFFDGLVNPTLGLLENVPYWVFIDWAPGMDGQRIGASASLNAFYYQALVSASSIARVQGDAARADRYWAKAAALKIAFQRFWNPAQGMYDDTLNGGLPSGRFTQHANALAVLYGLAPKEQWSAILDHIMAQTNVLPVGTPYFASYLLEAMYAAGQDGTALAYMRQRWGRMLDWGATAWWEKWEPTESLTHGWSSYPTLALPARILGVRPAAPGWTEWMLSPSLSDLQWARGAVPTPKGEIEAFWTLRPKGLHVEVTVPAGTTGLIRIPVAGLEGARWTVTQGTRAAPGVVLETVPGFWAARLTKPGSYMILATKDTNAVRSSLTRPTAAQPVVTRPVVSPMKPSRGR